MTQGQLAETIGVGQPAVSGWESGDFEPRRELWLVLADALGETVESLFFTHDGVSSVSA